MKLAVDYFGPNHIVTDWTRIRIAQFYIDTEQYAEAKGLLEMSLTGYQREYRSIPTKMVHVYHPLALVHMYQGNMKKALEYFTASQAIYAAHYRFTALGYYKEALKIIKDFPANSFHKTRLLSKVQNLGPLVSSHL